jgi:GMP synthase PP-ATPase subunit
MTAGETHQAIEAIFRIERARLIAGLARILRNADAVYIDQIRRAGLYDKIWRLWRCCCRSKRSA